jgi:hypothetical protein
MGQAPAQTITGVNPSSPHTVPHEGGNHAKRRRLVLVRIWWGVAALIIVGSFAARVPGHYADLQHICTGQVCAYGQLSRSAAETFRRFNISLRAYAILRTGLTLIVALIWFVIAAILAWRKATDWLALLLALWFLIAGAATITGVFGLGSGSTIQGHELYAQAVNLLAEFGAILVVFALFPTRRFAPRAAFWLLLTMGFFVVGPTLFANPLALWLHCGVLIGLVVAQIYYLWYRAGRGLERNLHIMTWSLMVVIGLALIFQVIAYANQSLTSLSAVLFFAALVGADVMQLTRYWQVTSPLGRQQTKWIAFGIAVFVTTATALLAPAIFVPSFDRSDSFYQTIHTVFFIIASLVIPVTVTIAILRYRLWDIDALINRTLVYGSLTGLLGALYATLLISLESLAQLINKQAGQPVTLVVSTLAVVALIQPLRIRLQQVIDRRFYRRKYDAHKTLAAFSAELQHEVDLEQVRGLLLGVVEETMQPTQVTLWLRQPRGHPADYPTTGKTAPQKVGQMLNVATRRQ